ncbi:hypothetical protein AAVH_11091 [Aphelenchoides avenae]|nr:hypothetical protein AAVH_11091 [Aphelenchus avenae]
MGTEGSALARRVYGPVERETNDTVIFISEQERRIRFQHIGMSLQYPSAAEYQCTQSASALAFRSACPVKPAKKVVADAIYDSTIITSFQKLKKAATHVAANTSETANVEDEDTDDVTILKVVGEPSAKIRRRSRAKRTSTLSTEEWEDKAFGKIRAVSPSTLTEAERPFLFSAPSISVGRMRGKALIAYRSQTHKRKFKFVLVGASSLEAYAFDYYCLNCWINHEEECRVTVHSSTLEFIITDPDQTSSGVEAESIRTQKVLAHTQSVSGSRGDTHLTDLDRTSTAQFAGAEAEPSRQMDSSGDQLTPEVASNAITTTGSARSSCEGDLDLGPAVEVPGELLQYTGITYSVSSTADPIPADADALAAFNREIDSAVDQAIVENTTVTGNNESSRQTDHVDLGHAVEALDEALQYPESSYSVSSAAEYVTDQHEREANVPSTQLALEGEQKPHRFAERREAANAKETNNHTPATSKANGTSRVSRCKATSGTGQRCVKSQVDVKPSTKKSADVVTIDDLDDDNDANDTSSASKQRRSSGKV